MLLKCRYLLIGERLVTWLGASGQLYAGYSGMVISESGKWIIATPLPSMRHLWP